MTWLVTRDGLLDGDLTKVCQHCGERVTRITKDSKYSWYCTSFVCNPGTKATYYCKNGGLGWCQNCYNDYMRLVDNP